MDKYTTIYENEKFRIEEPTETFFVREEIQKQAKEAGISVMEQPFLKRFIDAEDLLIIKKSTDKKPGYMKYINKLYPQEVAEIIYKDDFPEVVKHIVSERKPGFQRYNPQPATFMLDTILCAKRDFILKDLAVEDAFSAKTTKDLWAGFKPYEDACVIAKYQSEIAGKKFDSTIDSCGVEIKKVLENMSNLEQGKPCCGSKVQNI